MSDNYDVPQSLNKTGEELHDFSYEDKCKQRIIESTDSDQRILNFPECKLSQCPEKRSQFLLSSHIDHCEKQNLLKVQVCGNPDCCNKLWSLPGLVDFDYVCDVVTRQCKKLQEEVQTVPKNTRNKIYYCVSPSVYNDFHTLKAFNDHYNYARVEDIEKSRKEGEYCPHIHCCHKEKKTNSQLIKMNRKSKSTNAVVSKGSTGSEVQTYNYSFLSELHQDEDADLLNNIPENSKFNYMEPNMSPSASGMLKKYKKSSQISLTMTEDFPPTPMQSNMELLQGQGTSLLDELPLSPQNILSEHQIIVKRYLTASDDKAIFTQKGSLPKTIRKNQPEIGALLKAVYLTTSDDFPPSPDFSNTSQNEEIPTSHIDLKENVRRSSRCDKVDDLNTETSKENSCYPNNCDKLNFFGSKRWKNCCDNRFCPINDPTSSTYNFLLKVRMCCKTRGCQLAARICDIYEPLVQFDSEFDDVGEQQYHYLSADASTGIYSDIMPPVDIPTKEMCDTVSEISDVSQSEILSNVTEFDIDGDYDTADTYTRANARRTSTVSWSIPHDEEDLRTSLSEEQVIFQATAEADKFRQTQRTSIPKHVLDEIVRKSIQEPTKPTKSELSLQRIDKSQLDNIQQSDSRHKPKCCPLLRRKFLRKKKNIFEENDSQLKWGIHGQEKRKTLGNIQVQERSVEINHILNKM